MLSRKKNLICLVKVNIFLLYKKYNIYFKNQ